MRRRLRRPRATPPRPIIEQLRTEVAALAWEQHDQAAVLLLLAEGADPATQQRIRDLIDKPAPEEPT
jgi:hypothetical protein